MIKAEKCDNGDIHIESENGVWSFRLRADEAEELHKVLGLYCGDNNCVCFRAGMVQCAENGHPASIL